MTIKKIRLRRHHSEGPQFAAWLREMGIDAQAGDTFCSYVDDMPTDYNIEANWQLNRLWCQYCNESSNLV